MAAYRREDPEVTEIYSDRIAKTRRQRFDQLKLIGVERRLPRSYATVEECKAKARVVFVGARVVPDSTVTDTVRPGQITSCIDGPGVFQIGGGGTIIEHEAGESDYDATASVSGLPMSDKPGNSVETPPKDAQAHDQSNDKQQRPLGRPKKGGKLL